MVMFSIAYNMSYKKFIFIITLCLAPIPSFAASDALGKLAPLDFNAVYSFGFGAVDFGKIGVDISQTPDAYAMSSDIVSTGILNAFLKHSSHTTQTGKGAEFHYSSIDYETHYQTKGKKKYAHILYNDGVVTEEKVEPADDREKRPAVSKALKDQSVTPLGLVIAMQQGIYDSLKHNKEAFSVYMYDGRRLSQIHFALIGDKTMPINGVPTKVVQVDVSRTLLEGYTQSELTDAQKKDPPLHVYFSNDERLIPLLFEVPMWMGSIRATLVKECAKGQSCLFGISG